MRDETAIRRLARERGIRTDYAEKDHVNSWVLYGIYSTAFGDSLLFKGGTALSKLYFPDSWRFSEDLDFTVDGQFTGTEEVLRDALDTAARRSGIEFTLTEFYESHEESYPVYYIEASIQYRAMFDHKNTTELNIMGDEVVAGDPVDHDHDYQDVTQFSLTSYSLAEIFGEKLRTIYQRSRGRDYFDLFKIIVCDRTPQTADVASIFAAKRAHASDDAYHTLPEPRLGLPTNNREMIADDWSSTLPEVAEDVPPFDEVEQRISSYLTETLAPSLEIH